MFGGDYSGGEYLVVSTQGVSTEGVSTQGLSIQGGWYSPLPPPLLAPCSGQQNMHSWQAGDTHPTGMLSYRR